MNRFLRLTGIVVWIAVVIYSTKYVIDSFPESSLYILSVLGGMFLIYILIKLIYGDQWIPELGKHAIIGSDLISATERFLGELPKPGKEVTAIFTGHLVYRFTRLGLVGILIAIVPIWLLYEQNRRITIQNQLFSTQNQLIQDQIDQEKNLIESEQEKALMNNIFAAIDIQLKEDYAINGIRDLSPHLISRIVALNNRYECTITLREDSAIVIATYPENDILLSSMVQSKLDSLTMGEIAKETDFNYVNMSGKNFPGVNLKYAKLMGADFSLADLSHADLSHTDLTIADMSNADLSEANLFKSDLSNANLTGTILVGANLSQTDLSGTHVDRTFLRAIKNDEEDSIVGRYYVINNYHVDSVFLISDNKFDYKLEENRQE